MQNTFHRAEHQRHYVYCSALPQWRVAVRVKGLYSTTLQHINVLYIRTQKIGSEVQEEIRSWVLTAYSKYIYQHWKLFRTAAYVTNLCLVYDTFVSFLYAPHDRLRLWYTVDARHQRGWKIYFIYRRPLVNMKKKKKQEIATTISSRERRDTAYVLDVEGLKDRFNVENPHALITSQRTY